MTATLRQILLIDDDRLQCRLTQAQFSHFRGEKFILEWASSYEEGLERLLTGGFAACLLDFELGDRNGLELIREAVAAGCRTPIVFLTAESGERVDTAAMNAGALDCLVKGEFTASSLERSLRYAQKLAETLEAMRLLATHDSLTGLLNRREFDRILGEESERARRFDRSLSLILIDLDHFKKINDTLGHPMGDTVLQEVARRLSGIVRTVDRVARFGGEEFAILLMETDGAAAAEVAERARVAVGEEPIAEKNSSGLKVTLSAGIATFPVDATTPPLLVSAADQALYSAKAAGRNRVVAFTPPSPATALGCGDFAAG